MTQKVLKIGNSAAIIIPKRSLEELNMKIGDRVVVEIDKRRPAVLIEPLKLVDKKLLEWTRRFIKRYRGALEALARK